MNANNTINQVFANIVNWTNMKIKNCKKLSTRTKEIILEILANDERYDTDENRVYKELQMGGVFWDSIL